MQNGKTVTTGLVLRVTETKETDKILTVLTPDMGKIPLIARGARRKNSRIAAASQLLAYSELTLYKRGNWYMLDEASTLELFDGVRQDIVLLSLASYLTELAEAVCAEETVSPEILSLLLNALYALCYLGKEPRLVKAAYQFRLLALAGFEPLASACAVCGREAPEAPMLDVLRGVVHCGGCKQPGGLSMPLAAYPVLRQPAAVRLHAGACGAAGAGSRGGSLRRQPAGAELSDTGLLQIPFGVT